MERTLVLHKTNKELRVEKRRVEEQLAIIKKKNETLRDISWTQSHLVRAPLARMHSLIDLIKDHNSTEEERNEYLDYFETSLQELDVVIASISKKTYDENDENINN
jgi:light-regulated signal transduction histidine kinase (bacteriophytochrome)